MERSAHAWPGISSVKFGTWLFIVSEVMLFTGLIGTYLALRTGSVNWPEASETLDIPLTAVNTFILIMSSLTMVQSLASIERGNDARLRLWLAATALLGLTFLGIKLHDWSELIGHGYPPDSGAFAATFFTLTGFHAAHVAGGVIALAYLIGRSAGGAYTAVRHETVELVGVYWHFVDIVWIVLFTIIYLM
ncbi:MAG: heme-copper oxidase subunit III [Anaerolineae bacterium]